MAWLENLVCNCCKGPLTIGESELHVRRLQAHLPVCGPNRRFLARRVLRQFPRAGGLVGGERTRSRERERRRSNRGFLLALMRQIASSKELLGRTYAFWIRAAETGSLLTFSIGSASTPGATTCRRCANGSGPRESGPIAWSLPPETHFPFPRDSSISPSHPGYSSTSGFPSRAVDATRSNRCPTETRSVSRSWRNWCGCSHRTEGSSSTLLNGDFPIDFWHGVTPGRRSFSFPERGFFADSLADPSAVQTCRCSSMSEC